MGRALSTIHVLDDGRRVRMRLARPGDPLPADLTFYDPRERLVIVGLEMVGGREHIVAVADVVRAERTLEDAARELLDELATRRAA